MCLSLAYSLLVKEQLWNRRQFDFIATAAMKLMKEDDDIISVVDLTYNDDLVTEFIKLTKDPELLHLGLGIFQHFDQLFLLSAYALQLASR